MTSSRIFKLAISVGVALLGATFPANLMSATPEYEGKFTLPFEARWGNMVLPAGEYSFTADHLLPGSIIAIRRGRRYVGGVPVQSLSDHSSSGESELVAVRTGAGYRIRALRLQTGGEEGCVLEFWVPKAELSLVSQGSAAAQHLPISANGR